MADPVLMAEFLARRNAELTKEAESLKFGGGDGTSGGMDGRVAKLEAHMEHVRADLGRLASVPADLKALQVKVDHLPGKGFIVTALIGGLAVIAALIAFGEKIQALVG